ncbi:MAG: aquaporin [Thermoanaerobaculia bacterium]
MSRAHFHHWPEYLIEAGGLGLFMVSAGLFGTLLFAPGSPALVALPSELLRRALMGLAMGGTAVGLIYSPWGQRSGAHFNPAVTLTFLRLGKVSAWDAGWYILAQAAGGTLGVLVVAALVGPAFTTLPVDWVVTEPGRWGVGAAFLAELGISALLMGTVLTLSNHPRMARFTGLAAGCLVALYILLEAPVSGMSMNPARTFASALPSGQWRGFWIYLAAPLAGMSGASWLYCALAGRHRVRCAKLHHTHTHRCIFRCGHCLHGSDPQLG